MTGKPQSFDYCRGLRLRFHAFPPTRPNNSCLELKNATACSTIPTGYHGLSAYPPTLLFDQVFKKKKICLEGWHVKGRHNYIIVNLRGRVGLFCIWSEYKQSVRGIHVYLLKTFMWAQLTTELQNILNNTNNFKILLLKLQRKQNGNSERVRRKKQQQRKLLTVRRQHSWCLT